MKVIFMGTPEIAAKNLEKIYEVHEVAAVFTQPDKPNARGNKVNFSPVKEFAVAKGIPLYQPKTLKDGEAEKIIREINPDILVVVAYGKILPMGIIEAPKYGAINLHASLLPKYRGASPIHAAVINGEEKTGVTVMYINEKLDEGDMILKEEVIIEENDNVGTVYDKLAEIGKGALLKAMEMLENGEAKPERQNHDLATFTRPIEKDECKIDWGKTKEEIYNFVRGLNPFPVAFSTINEKRFKIYEVEKVETIKEGKIGEVVDRIKEKGPVVKVANGGIVIKLAKPENKGFMAGKDLLNGNYIKENDIFI